MVGSRETARHRARRGPGVRARRAFRQGVVTLVTAAAFLPVLASSNVARADQIYPTPSSGVFTVTGHGYGHGHGMSQYGAQGAALHGLTAAQITGFYYPGTALASGGNPAVRVRLSAIEGAPLVAVTRPGLRAVDGAGHAYSLPGPYPLWRVLLNSSDGRFWLQHDVNGAWVNSVEVPGPVRLDGVPSMTIQFGRNKAYCKGLPSVTYAGAAVTLSDSGVQRSSAVMSREIYLGGVVASEMPSGWPAAALQAQAIAARSYVGASMSSSRWYDVWDTTSSQCWDGDASRHPSTDSAIAATSELIRTYGGRPAFTQFASSDGGWTSAGSVPYLVAQADPYEQYSSNPYATWIVSVPASSFAALDGSGGVAHVSRVRVTARSGGGDWGGRVATLVVDGTTASGSAVSYTATGDQVRSALGLKSTYFSPGSTATPPAGGAWTVPPVVWRGSTQTFYVNNTPIHEGASDSVPVVLDRNGDGTAEYATYTSGTATWAVNGGTPFGYGNPGDIPVAGAIAVAGHVDIGVFRPANAEWFFPGRAGVYYGAAGDVPELRDFTGDGRADLAVYRPSNHTWYISGVGQFAWGADGDIPVPADFTGDHRADIAVFRPSNQTFYVRGIETVRYGNPGDVPVVGDYNRDGRADLAVFRPSNATWYPQGLVARAYGNSTDVPVPPLG